MEKKQICKICNKRFANGKAMGGHMRSHLAKLPVPPKPNPSPIQTQKQHFLPPNNPYSQKPSFSPSSSSSLNYTSSGNPLHSYYKSKNPISNLANTTTSVTAVTFLDGEGEAESPRNPTRKRSKRLPKSVEKVKDSILLKVNDQSPERLSSSVSDRFNEEDAATCLLMLSSSTENKSRKGKQVIIEEEVDEDKFLDEEDEEVGIEHQSEEEDEEEEEEEEKEDESYCLTRPRSFKSHHGKYRCETCNKTFRSYQALGGHRASHKKIKSTNSVVKEDNFEDRGSASFDNVVGGVVDYRMFKCSFCDKVFESGQALGGHKKVHFPYLGNNPIPNPKSSIPSRAKNLIDLNLPPLEDQEDEWRA